MPLSVARLSFPPLAPGLDRHQSARLAQGHPLLAPRLFPARRPHPRQYRLLPPGHLVGLVRLGRASNRLSGLTGFVSSHALMRSAETFFVSLGLWTYNIFLGLFLVATRNTSSTAILIAVACALSAEKFKLQVYFSVHLGKETDTTWILAGILVDSRLCLSGLRQKLLLSHQDPGQCPRSVRCRAGEGQALCRREQLYHFPVRPRNERRRRRRGTTKHLV